VLQKDAKASQRGRLMLDSAGLLTPFSWKCLRAQILDDSLKSPVESSPQAEESILKKQSSLFQASDDWGEAADNWGDGADDGGREADPQPAETVVTTQADDNPWPSEDVVDERQDDIDLNELVESYSALGTGSKTVQRLAAMLPDDKSSNKARRKKKKTIADSVELPHPPAALLPFYISVVEVCAR
jgi:hypothetical protein